jgi:hypothetical protein
VGSHPERVPLMLVRCVGRVSGNPCHETVCCEHGLLKQAATISLTDPSELRYRPPRGGLCGIRNLSHTDHLLIVDDDREIRELVSRFLKRHGYRVSTARDGREMQAILATSRIDLVVLDSRSAHANCWPVFVRSCEGRTHPAEMPFL